MEIPKAYSEIALCRFASSQPFTELVHELMFPSPDARDWSIPHGFFLKFDRHGWQAARTEDKAAKVLKDSDSQSIDLSVCLSKLLGE